MVTSSSPPSSQDTSPTAMVTKDAAQEAREAIDEALAVLHAIIDGQPVLRAMSMDKAPFEGAQRELEAGELWAAYPLGTPATFDGTNLQIFRGCMPDAEIGQIRGFAISGSPVRIMECVEMTSDKLTFREVGE